MKQLFILSASVFFVTHLYAQDALNLTVQASNIHLWKKPEPNAMIPNEVLKNGEKIVLINSVIEVRNGFDPFRFARIYRNGNNQVPYYINLQEVGGADRGVLFAARDAVTNETNLDNLWLPMDNNVLNIGDVFFMPKSECVYTFLDRASYSNSSHDSIEYDGFYKINKIVSCQVENRNKVLLYCLPMNTGLNENKKQAVYIDFYKCRDALSFINLKYGGDFSILMNAFANKFPNSSSVPSQFYQYFLNYLYGEQTFAAKDEFEKHRLLTSGKPVMDSIYNCVNQVYSTPLSTVYAAWISDYNFTAQSFEIQPTTAALDGRFTRILQPLQGLYSIPTQSLYDLSDADVYDASSTKDFINLSQFSTTLKIVPDEAEKLVKELESNKLSYASQPRQLILIINYKYISQAQLKDFYRQYHVLNQMEIDFPKLIESIDVYSTEGFTKDQLINARALTLSDKNSLHKLATIYPNGSSAQNQESINKVDIEASFPGGSEAWSRYENRAIQSHIGEFSESDYGTCLVKFMVDKMGRVSDVQATNMIGTKLADVAVNAIKNGPNWVPAQAGGRFVNSYKTQAVTLSR